jgi:hypothetical protein
LKDIVLGTKKTCLQFSDDNNYEFIVENIEKDIENPKPKPKLKKKLISRSALRAHSLKKPMNILLNN